MIPLETHELAPLVPGSALPDDFSDDHDEQKPNYLIRRELENDEGSDHENENEGVGIALLGERSRPNGASGIDVSRPKTASQVVKTIISEVLVYSTMSLIILC